MDLSSRVKFKLSVMYQVSSESGMSSNIFENFSIISSASYSIDIKHKLLIINNIFIMFFYINKVKEKLEKKK